MFYNVSQDIHSKSCFIPNIDLNGGDQTIASAQVALPLNMIKL